jgi:hypothetical protein
MTRRAAAAVRCGLVQAIRLRWTKAARGGEGARARCAVPTAFEVPAVDFVSAEDVLCVDVSQWGDKDTFAEPFSASRKRIALAEGTTFGCVTVSAEANGLRVSYQYNWAHAGAPDRSFKRHRSDDGEAPVRTVLVRDQEWVRVCYNGRFTCIHTGDWWYQQVTVNVAWFAGEPDWRVFLDQEPVREIRELADLW